MYISNALQSIFETLEIVEVQIRQEIQDPIDHILDAIKIDNYCIYELKEPSLIINEISQLGGNLKDSLHKLEKMQHKFEKLEKQKKSWEEQIDVIHEAMTKLNQLRSENKNIIEDLEDELDGI